VSRLLDNLLAFGRLLRRVGLDVHPGRLLDATEALLQVDISRREDFYHACRTCLVHRREDLPIFDRAFDAFWRRHGDPAHRRAGAPDSGRERAGDSDSRVPIRGAPGPQGDAAARAPANDTPQALGVVRTWSGEETLAHKDFAEFTADELAIAREALDRLAWRPGERRSRRFFGGKGARVDLRRALARAVRTGGDVATLPRRRRRTRPRPLVVLCDVSGSMARYSRMLLHFGHALTQRHRQVEAFVFSTRLTRVTREIRRRSLDVALDHVSRSVVGWSGGTRIGSALKELHQRWSRRVLHGGAVVLLISDGWDRGDPSVLREQMARLQRSCHRLIWLNPLIGTIDYAPLTRGLQAALPYVDDFLPARTLTNLADLAVHLNTLAASSRGDR